MESNLTLEERRKRAYKYLKDDIEMIMTDYFIELTIRLLTIKFGILPKEIKDKLSKADSKNLELVIEKLINSNSIDQIIWHLN